jgi:tetratricopeptide (TPR) repeat protein
MTEILTSEHLSEQGKEFFKDKKYAEAAEAFRTARDAFQADGDEINAAENGNNLCIALVKMDENEQALQAVEGTPEVFARAGDTRRQAMACGNMGMVLRRLGQREEAVAAYELAADLFKEIGEKELRAPVLTALSDLQLLTGRPLEALATADAGLQGNETNAVKRFFRKLLQLPIRYILRS